MQDYLREQIDWPQPFGPEECAARLGRVRKAMQAAKLDALYVTTPANLTWLTGYDMIWYHTRCQTGMLIRADNEATVWFDGVVHTAIVSLTPAITDAVWFTQEDTPALVEAIAARLPAKARVALEPWGYAPHASVMQEIRTRVEAKGAAIAEAATLIERLRLVKSPAEIAMMRQAAVIADDAMQAAAQAMVPGAMETQVEAAIAHSMMNAGGGYAAIRTMVGSGLRSGTHHSAPTHRKLRSGDLVFVDFCSSLHRYHVNLNRTFSLGAPDPRWADLMQRSVGSVDAIQAAVKPGDLWSKVATVGRAYLEEQGIAKHLWWHGGYALGIAVPPDWTGAYWAEPWTGEPDLPLEPGMVFNYENQYDVFENWSGGSGAAFIETFLVTETGLEVLSKLPRNLVTLL